MRHACVRGDEMLTAPSPLPPQWRDPADGTMYTALHLWTAAELSALGWLPVRENRPDHDPTRERLAEGAARIEDGLPVVDWTIENLVPGPSEEERIEAALTGDIGLAAAIEEIAARLGITPRQFIDGAKTRASQKS